MTARTIDHVDIGDLVTLAPRQRRQETVQAIEIRQLQEQIAPERLQPASGIARAVTQDRAAHAIGDARLQLLEAGCLAADALPGDEADLRPLDERLDQS